MGRRVDVGSVSTNLVLLDEDYRVLQGEYLPTRGEPVPNPAQLSAARAQ
jgi:activator of 2-hydroxyglutaryl-CoA dehydratase